MTLDRIQRDPMESVVESMSMGAEVVSNSTVQIEGGEYVFNTNQVRLKINLTPTMTTWIRDYPHLEVTFRGKVYKVLDREEQYLYAILTCG